ncbi:uncharacterized protein CCOS01_08038 [Colletotrichum costaricense]|uniref:Uncharacterized protein n=1 Tax=Colletotrichum costaricense TaxID=1209916 RepID=A0AAI9YV33_9PEZI|nr:uncharacterized protein CCOS01_08038 [Colletotrichum costaricense]KAK1525620.1 hypothetical protein CCOS01_08038 [Colletotrichum costaricense]
MTRRPSSFCPNTTITPPSSPTDSEILLQEIALQGISIRSVGPRAEAAHRLAIAQSAPAGEAIETTEIGDRQDHTSASSQGNNSKHSEHETDVYEIDLIHAVLEEKQYWSEEAEAEAEATF